MEYYKKKGIVVRDAKEADVIKLEATLNEEFAKGLNDAHDKNKHQPMLMSFKSSQRAIVVTDGGNPVLVFGIVPNPVKGEKDCLWVKNSIQVKKKYKTVIVQFREMIKRMLERYPVLFNYIENKHISMIRAILFCGAEIERFNADKVMFTIRRGSHV